MKKTIKLTENDLIRIIERVINEQNDIHKESTSENRPLKKKVLKKDK